MARYRGHGRLDVVGVGARRADEVGPGDDETDDGCGCGDAVAFIHGGHPEILIVAVAKVGRLKSTSAVLAGGAGN